MQELLSCVFTGTTFPSTQKQKSNKHRQGHRGGCRDFVFVVTERSYVSKESTEEVKSVAGSLF